MSWRRERLVVVVVEARGGIEKGFRLAMAWAMAWAAWLAGRNGLSGRCWVLVRWDDDGCMAFFSVNAISANFYAYDLGGERGMWWVSEIVFAAQPGNFDRLVFIFALALGGEPRTGK